MAFEKGYLIWETEHPEVRGYIIEVNQNSIKVVWLSGYIEEIQNKDLDKYTAKLFGD